MKGLIIIFSYRLWAFLFVAAISCTIIQDGDIASPEDAAKLKLTGIQISEVTNTLGNNSVTITSTIDKQVNISTANGLVTRYVEMNLTAWAGKKFKLRSNVTFPAKMFVYYYSTGYPSSFGIFKENLVNGVVHDSVYFEFYRFRYNNSNQLNKVVTFINPTQPCCTVATTNDTIVYGSNRILSATRRSPDASKAGIFGISYISQGGQTNYFSNLTFILNSAPTVNHTFGITGGTCNTCQTQFNSSATYNQNYNNNPVTSYSMVTISSLVSKMTKLTLNDQLVSFSNSGGGGGGSGSGGPRLPDTYYLHPMLLLQNDFPHGEILLNLYMQDWWILGGSTSSPNYTKDDFVTLTFSYVK